MPSQEAAKCRHPILTPHLDLPAEDLMSFHGFAAGREGADEGGAIGAEGVGAGGVDGAVAGEALDAVC